MIMLLKRDRPRSPRSPRTQQP